MYNGMRVALRIQARVSAARAAGHSGRFRSPSWTRIAMRPWHARTAQPLNPATELRLIGVLDLRLGGGSAASPLKERLGRKRSRDYVNALIDSGP